MAQFNIEYKSQSFYYDTESCKLYWFENPNKDVEICKDVLLIDVLNQVANHVTELLQDLQMDMDACNKLRRYILNEIDATDSMLEIVAEIESRYEDLRLRYNIINEAE